MIEKNEFICLSDEEAKRVREDMPEERSLTELAELFKVFADPTRVRILYALMGAELCVGDLSNLLGMTQTAVSHQLRVLRASKLVRGRKTGKTVFYALADTHVSTVLAQGMEHVNE